MRYEMTINLANPAYGLACLGYLLMSRTVSEQHLFQTGPSTLRTICGNAAHKFMSIALLPLLKSMARVRSNLIK